MGLTGFRGDSSKGIFRKEFTVGGVLSAQRNALQDGYL